MPRPPLLRKPSCVFRFEAAKLVMQWLCNHEDQNMQRMAVAIISIPYLNIITRAGVVLTNQELYLVRFIPLIRAAAALAIVISYVSKNKIVGLFATYMAIMVIVVYFASLIFLQREQGVNPDITGYWTSLWWCCLETTTIGAPINPVTPTGKVLAFVLSGMGMIMFPLFTVYLTDLVRKYMKAKPKTAITPKS